MQVDIHSATCVVQRFPAPAALHRTLQLHAILCLLTTVQGREQIDFWWGICNSRISSFYHKLGLWLLVFEKLPSIIKANSGENVGNFHFKMVLSPFKIRSPHFSVITQTLTIPQVLQCGLWEPGCQFEGNRTCITSNSISPGISSSWSLCLSKTQKSKNPPEIMH